MKRFISKLSFLVLPVMFLSVLQGCGQEKQVQEESKVDTTDGKVWSINTGGAINSSPVLYGDNIIFGNSERKLYSINKDTKAENWIFNADGPITNTPIVDKDTIIFATYTTCYSIDGKTGKENWKLTKNIPTKENLSGWDYHAPSPVLYGEEIVFTLKSGNVFGINKADGKVIWEYKNDDAKDVITTPGISQDIMVLGDVKGAVYGVDLKTQKTLWQKSIGKDVVHAASAYKDFAYFSGRDCIAKAVDIKTGEEKWRYTDKGGSWLTGEILIQDDKVYVPGSDNLKLGIFKYDTGDSIAIASSKANIFSKTAVKDNLVYYTDGNVYSLKYGGIHVFDLKTNEVVWENNFDAPIYSSPLVVGDMIYFGSTDGNFYAVKYPNK